MSTFHYPIEVGDINRSNFSQVDALVDTGAAYTLIPRPILEMLGYSPTGHMRFRLADGSIIERGTCQAALRIGQETLSVLCIFGDEDSIPLLGATALEEFALGVDQIHHTLVPVVLNLLGILELSPQENLIEDGKAARAAARKLARLPSADKDRALLNIADALIARQEEVLAANEKDYQAGKASGLTDALLDRLLLTPQRIEGIARDVRGVAALPDPVGEVFDMRTLPNGLMAGKKRVPMGVIGAIYESRPNVTVDISVLCLKSGNACILRGGREAVHSNTALAVIIRSAIADAGVPEDALRFIDNTDRALVEPMLKMREYIDLLVPRGGPDLIRFVAETAAMPVVTGGIGVCHTYVDRSADLDKAVDIAYNAKVQRPTVCNALDSLLVHSEAAPRYLPRIARELAKAGVEIRCDRRALSILGPAQGIADGIKIVPATEEDWGKEFLALVAAVKVVDSLDEALEHIEKYGSGHSEAIVAEDYSAAMRFLEEVDAAAVYANASTRFTDGAEFGLGAEVGISTQKYHARGPMGLREMTSYKWIILGSGQIRP